MDELDAIRQSTKTEGMLHLIVRHPEMEMREALEKGELDPRSI